MFKAGTISTPWLSKQSEDGNPNRKYRALPSPLIGLAMATLLCLGMDLLATALGRITSGSQVISLAAEEAVDKCFEDVTTEQPFYMVTFATAFKQTVTNALFPIHYDPESMTWKSICIQLTFIALAAYGTFTDLKKSWGAEWYCLGIVWTGSSQIITLLQLMLNAYLSIEFKEIARKEGVIYDPRRSWLLKGFACVMSPYFIFVPLAFCAFCLPGSVWFFPITLLLLVLSYLYIICFFCGNCLLNYDPKKSNLMHWIAESDAVPPEHAEVLLESDAVPPEHAEVLPDTNPEEMDKLRQLDNQRAQARKDFDAKNPVIASAGTQSTMTPFIVSAKFLGECMARRYTGSNWSTAIYSTWSERTMGGYFKSLFRSMSSIMSTVLSLFP